MTGLHWADRRHAVLCGDVLPAVALVGMVALWFTSGRFLAAGDISPFFRTGLSSELTQAWSHRITGAGSASYEIVRLPEVVCSWIAGLIGAGPVFAQFLFYALAVTLASIGVSRLARALGSDPIGCAVAGLLAVVNPLMLVNLPNPLPLVAVGVVGLVGSLVIRASRGATVSGRKLALATLPASYLAINPPTLLVTVFSIIAIAVSARWLTTDGSTTRSARFVARSAIWIIAVHLWWLVPAVIATFGDHAGVSLAAQTNASSWSWSHVQNSLDNVVTLRAHWGWRHPEYFPFAHELDRPIWRLAAWCLPVFGVLAIILNRPLRRTAIALAIPLPALWFLAKGIHAPFASANRFLYAHVPGFWLLREPMSKIGPTIVIVYCALAGLTTSGLIASARRGSRVARTRSIAVAGLMIGAVAYPHALWTGAAFAASRDPLPRTEVDVPSGWHRVADFVNQHAREGKVLELPLDPYYQVTTRWGYHGVDDLLSQLISQPVIQRLPGGYFAQTPNFDGLLDATQQALTSGHADEATRLLKVLGVTTVVVRDDLITGPGDSPISSVEAIERCAHLLADGSDLAEPGIAHVYSFDPTYSGLVTTSTRPQGVERIGSVDLARATGSMPDASVGLPTPMEASDYSVQLDDESTSARINLAAPGAYQIAVTSTRGHPFRAETVNSTTADGVRQQLRLTDQTQTALDSKPVSTAAALDIPVDFPTGINRVDALELDDTLALVDTPLPVVSIRTNQRVTGYGASTANLLRPLTSAELGDCANTDQTALAQNSISLRFEADDSLELRARRHSACAWIDTLVKNPGWYRIEVGVRSAGSTPARICLWQVALKRCAHLPDVGTSSTWMANTLAARVEPGSGPVVLYLYADAGPTTTDTQIEYRSLRLQELKPVTESVALPATTLQRYLSAGQHTVSFTTPPNPKLEGSPTPLSDCAATTGTKTSGSMSVDPSGAITLSAVQDSSCTWMPVTSPPPVIRIRMDYESRSGLPARMCVWLTGPNRCADMPALDSANGRHQLDRVVILPANSVGVRLYIYADGQTPRTEITYGHISVSSAMDSIIELVNTSTPNRRDSPTVVLGPHSSTAYRAQIGQATRPYVLVLNESYSSRWTLSATAGTVGRHFEANGYANGWEIQPPSDGRPVVLKVTYRPQSLASVAIAVSLAAALLCGATTVITKRRRTRRTVPSTIGL